MPNCLFVFILLCAGGAPASQPSTEPIGAITTVKRFFDALRARELDVAKALCWAPAETFDRDFDREWPSESKKLASGKRVIAVLDAREANDVAVVIFNEDVGKKPVGGKLEPLWLIKLDGEWKVIIGGGGAFLDGLTEAQRMQTTELRRWFSLRKQEIADETDRAGK